MTDQKPETVQKPEGKKAYTFEQREVNYVPLSTTPGQACGGCRWFNDANTGEYHNSPYCHIVQGWPLPIRATGVCDQFSAIPEPEPTYSEVQEELLDALEDIEAALGSAEKKPSLKERLLQLIGVKGQEKPALTSGFKNIGNHQWIGWFSNNFEDLQGEYFPARATDEFIARIDRKEASMPELYFWHVPFRFGEAKSIARVSLDNSPTSPSFTVAVGVYDDTPIARAFEKAMGKREYPMSHGFKYAPAAKIGGAYHYYDTFEVSPLPPYAPANPFTLFEDGKAMPILDEKKRKEFVALLGEDYVKDIEGRAETRLKELQEEGIAYKEMPIVDAEARQKLDTLSKQISDLTEQVKAALKPADEDDDKKKKKAEEDAANSKKEIDTQIQTLTQQVATLSANVKSFLDLTPRQATKDQSTIVPGDDPALKELQQGAAGEKSNEDKIFNGAFGWMPGVVNGGNG